MNEIALHSGEHIILSVRKHWIILVGSLIPYVILDYLPYLLPRVGAFLDSLNPAGSISYGEMLSFGNPWVDFIVGVYWLFVWMGAFGVFTNYFLDQWIITNERIIDINQVSFWNRDISSLFFDRVENVETELHGLFTTLFHVGTVSVESAGAEVGRVRMNGLPNPSRVRDIILAEVAKRHQAARTS